MKQTEAEIDTILHSLTLRPINSFVEEEKKNEKHRRRN